MPSLHIKVYDTNTLRPVTAKITLNGFTTINSEVTITDIPSGTYTLTVEAAGYTTYTKTITITTDTIHTVRLVPKAYLLGSSPCPTCPP